MKVRSDQEHSKDENVDDNTHGDIITVDDENSIDDSRLLPDIVQEQSSIRSRLKPRIRTPNSHRDSYSKEFIGVYTQVKGRVTWRNNKKRKRKRTKLNVKDKFRSIVAICMTLLSKHNKHATVSVKRGKKDTTKKQWIYC